MSAWTVDEKRLYREEHDLETMERYRRGVPVGLAIITVIGLIGVPTSPPEAHVIAMCVVSAILTVGVLPVLRVYPRPRVVLQVAAAGICTAVGFGAAVLGGFESIATSAVLLVWMFGSVFTPHPPLQFAVGALSGLGGASLMIALRAPHPGSPAWFLTVTVAAIGLLTAGMALREKMAFEEFLTRRRLDAANKRLEDKRSELARLNLELRARVTEQVGEIVGHAADIESLHLQLSARVKDRSRELAVALSRLGRGPRRLEPGTELRGRARIVRHIGAGGMGDVYLAEDLVGGGRRVVVKTLRARRAADRANLRRFLAEAAAAATIGHPGIVRVLHVDVTEDGQLFQIMEYVDGETLAARLARGGPLWPARLARVGQAVASALASAHAAGVIHRDVKPANVMLTPSSPGVRVLDFGLSKLRMAPPGAGALEVTGPNQIMGTPAYMSPEQIHDTAGVWSPTDVYSLGVVLFEAVTGRRPFDADTAGSLFEAHASQPVPALPEDVPLALAGWILRCLEKQPADRPTALLLAEGLGAIADEEGAADACEVAALEMEGRGVPRHDPYESTALAVALESSA